MEIFWSVFITVFLAELGDKTQLATVLFSGKAEAKPLWVFLASASALVLASAIGVFIGTTLKQFIDPAKLKIPAGILFIALGIWTIVSD